MSNDTTQQPVERLSPSSLAAYAYCPRKYDFAKAQRIDTIDDSKRYLQQGLAMHGTIERTCCDSTRDDDGNTIRERMRAHFPEVWEEEVELSEFASDAQHVYYRKLAQAGLEHFFAPNGGPGIEHARQSVAVEKRLTCDCNDVQLKGYADNILRTEDGLHVIDYKRNISSGMLTSGTAERLDKHLNGEEHEPKRVKNAMQVATYLEGVTETDFFEQEMDVRFSFYGLLNHTDFETSPDGYSVSARGYGREMTEIYADHFDTIWSLIRSAFTGIREGQFEPEPQELIFEEGCPDCRYQGMCPDYLAQEVKL
ncbi:RecB family exonuclease [Halodesulfurarchaeum sp.]|uniref:RecB family exonuclease n=1 Tax=Halodesulfurarchaeum sp. TaxID=1980530 RepID=UPI002FC2E3B6